MANQFIEPLKGGIFAGLGSAVISGLLNFYILSFPETMWDHAVGHSIGGFCAGFCSAFIGITIFMLQQRGKHKKAEIQTG